MSEQCATSTSVRPRLLFITADYRSKIVENNLETMVYRIQNWLKFHFDVSLKTGVIDLDRAIEETHPDMILFDGMIEGCQELRPVLNNLRAHPNVPRAGLFVSDSLSPTRRITAEYLNSLGAEAYFVIGDTTLGESFSEIADRIIYVPQFVDPSVYRDYGLFKSIPVLLAGNWEIKQYPWRQSVGRVLLERFPTLYLRHPGYDVKNKNAAPIRFHGESFARMLNSALITPTSGGFKNIAVSKHVEIPAARSCLISDMTPGVELMGFKHMEHGVFVRAEEAPDAVDFLLRNPEQRERITDAGFAFAQSVHTIPARRQMVDWLHLRKAVGVSHKDIVQVHPLSSPTVSSPAAGLSTYHQSGSEDWKIIREIDVALHKESYGQAIELCDRALDFCYYLAEPTLRRGVALLLSGRAEEGFKEILKNIEWSTSFGATEPDPLDLTYFMIASLAVGKFDVAFALTRAWPSLQRLEVVRGRWAVVACLGQLEHLFDLNLAESECGKQSPSIQQFPVFSRLYQMRLFETILERANRSNLTFNLRKCLAAYEQRPEKIISFSKVIEKNHEGIPSVEIPVPLELIGRGPR